MKKIIMLGIVACALTAGAAFAQTTHNKRVVKINATSTADGSMTVEDKPLKHCIESLPSPKNLAADVTAKSLYLKGINGEQGKDGHTQVYTATVTVNYKVRQTFVLIVGTSSIEGQEPVMQEQERDALLTKTFTSDDSGEGDIFAGRSNRKYYYTSAESASKNAMAQANAWLKQQQSVMCAAGGGK